MQLQEDIYTSGGVHTHTLATRRVKKRLQTWTRTINLKMKQKMTDLKDKRFSFFADPQKNKEKECHHTFAHLAACIHSKPTREGSQKSKSSDTHYFVYDLK